jgi:hypothetical protein
VDHDDDGSADGKPVALAGVGVFMDKLLSNQLMSRLLLAIVALVSLPACRVVGGIFKAGVGVGVILAVVVVGLLFALVTKTRA